MRDENNFPDPLSFNGFRFVGRQHTKDNSNEQEKSSAGILAKGSFLTDSSDSLIWGLGRIVWSVACSFIPRTVMHFLREEGLMDCSPGRFYATAVLKLVVATMLLNYDCELSPIRGERSFQWRSSVIPKRSIKLMVQRRDSSTSVSSER